ncbi:hypothetical protein ACMGE5_11250 [Macrococcus equi]|uniref:hypothetical protein n=1 Tax=Macrococcus equi TaxID=3395462 RepID=UPI0039BDCACA
MRLGSDKLEAKTRNRSLISKALLKFDKNLHRRRRFKKRQSEMRLGSGKLEAKTRNRSLISKALLKFDKNLHRRRRFKKRQSEMRSGSGKLEAKKKSVLNHLIKYGLLLIYFMLYIHLIILRWD